MATRSRMRLDYATDIDPTMSTFGWKVIGLTYVAVLLPALGAFLPRDAAVRWPWFWLAIGCGVLTLAVNAVHLRRMVASRGYREPPALMVLAEVSMGTIAAGILNYALSGAAGLYRPLIFVPTLLIAMIANRVMIAISWLIAVATVTWSSLAQGTEHRLLGAFVIAYGSSWAIAATMVHALAATSLRSDQQTLGLADAATIAARATTLDDGIEQLMPVVADWAKADKVAAFRLGDDRELLVSKWPTDTEAPDAPTASEVDEARLGHGAHVIGGRWVLVAQSVRDEVIAVVVEGSSRPVLDMLTHRFNLERMALQIEILVNRSRYIERLEDLGSTDGLTTLPNRRALGERLATELRVAHRRGVPLALVMIDLDGFKGFNDAWGHLAGDELLKEFARTIRARLRASDFVARYGGEEFCLLLPETDGAGALKMLTEIHQRVREVEKMNGVTFSSGIAVWDGTETDEELLRRSDTALYAAKADGKDRSVVSHARPSEPPG